MRLCVSDSVLWDYNAETPCHRASGGMHSSACHLCAALARLGHDIVLLTHTSEPGLRLGVECVSWRDLSAVTELRYRGFDAVVSLTANPFPLRDLFGADMALFLWTGHADDQPPVECLTHAEVRDAWSGFIFASEWQRGRFIERFALSPARTSVLRYAIAPVFEKPG